MTATLQKIICNLGTIKFIKIVYELKCLKKVTKVHETNLGRILTCGLR